MDFIYDWYIRERLGSCFHDDFDFFVNIVNDIQTKKKIKINGFYVY